MLADEFPQWNNPSPKSVGKATVQFNHYIKNCDAVIQKAVAAGATLVAPVQDQFYRRAESRTPSVTSVTSQLMSKTSALQK